MQPEQWESWHGQKFEAAVPQVKRTQSSSIATAGMSAGPRDKWGPPAVSWASSVAKKADSAARAEDLRPQLTNIS